MHKTILSAIAILHFGLIYSSGLTLSEAEQRAIDYNETLQGVQNHANQSHYEYQAQQAQWLPKVSLQGNISRSQYKDIFDDQTHHQYDLILEQPIFNTDLYNTTKIKKYTSSAEKMYAFTTRQELLYQVRCAYYRVILLQEQLKVRQDNIDTLKQARDEEKIKLQAGTTTEFHLLESEVAVANTMDPYYTALQELKRSQSSLVRLLGEEAQSSETLSLTEDSLPIKDIPFIYDKLTNLSSSNTIFSDTEIEDWLKKAFDNRPEIKLYHARQQAANSVTKLAKGRYLPNLSFLGDYRKTSNTFLYGKEKYWEAGLRAEWTLFDGLGRLKNVHAARHGESAAKVNLQNVKRDIGKEVKDTFYILESALFSYHAADSSAKLADKALEQAWYQLKNGTLTPLEFREASQALTEARYNKNLAAYKLIETYYLLMRRTGQI